MTVNCHIAVFLSLILKSGPGCVVWVGCGSVGRKIGGWYAQGWEEDVPVHEDWEERREDRCCTDWEEGRIGEKAVLIWPGPDDDNHGTHVTARYHWF